MAFTNSSAWQAGFALALLALTSAPRVAAANLLTATPNAIAITCNTASGPGAAARIVIKPAATLTSSSIAVSLATPPAGVVVTAPASTTLNAANQAAGLTYSVNLAARCAGASSGSTTLQFNAGGVADVAVAVTSTVVTAPSPLTMTPQAVTVTCVKNPANYTPGPAQALLVSSAVSGGTPFTLDSTTVPAWLSVTPANGGTATAAGLPLSLSAVSPCGSYAAGSSNPALIHLHDAPYADALLAVTLLVAGPTPLSTTPAAATLAYTKNSATPAGVDVAVAAAQAAAFTVDATTLPVWLSIDSTGGTTPKTLHLSTTAAADAIAPGVYGANVRLQVAGAADLLLPVSLSIQNAPPTLSISEGTTRNFNWTIGQPLPLAIVTLVSTDAAIPYSITTAGTLAPAVGSGALKGVAGSSGTPVLVTFDQAAFSAAIPGSVLTGSLTVAWGTPAKTTVVNFKVTVQAAGANIQSVSPAILPTAAAGKKFTVALVGSGFQASADVTQQSVAGIVSNGKIVSNSSVTASVVNGSNILLSILMPVVADPLLPFTQTGNGGTVTLGVCNPVQGAACTTPASTVVLTIGSYPVIQSVTSSSSFLQVSPPTLTTIAPYDMISLFGINFCVAAAKGCVTDILYGAPDALTLRYPQALTPDAPGAGQRMLTVSFQSHTTPPAVIGNATLLFATNNQINLLVPGELAAYTGKPVDILVNFGVTSGGAARASAPFTVSVAAANPGIFAIGGDGQGDGAILGPDWSLIGKGNEAAMRQAAADSDVVQIYVSGLGAPDSTADNATVGKGAWPGDCVSTSSFLASFNRMTSGSVPSINGALILSSALNTGRIAPCLSTAASQPAVTIGGQPATVVYAGWAPDLVAGQYQLNVRLPGFGSGPFTTASGDVINGALTSKAELPVVVSARGRSSQNGVTLWVAPRLKLTPPASAALTAKAGVAWTATAAVVAASGGTAPYQYSIAGGALPAGLTLNATTGVISGATAADAAGTYPLTITATDSAAAPLTGSVSFSIVITAAR